MPPDSPTCDDLHEKTERLYTVFAAYRKPPVEACIDTLGAPIPHSVWVAWNKPLRLYRSEEADRFGFVSLCCHIEQSEYSRWFKYWLPRFLQGKAKRDDGLRVFDQDFLIEGYIPAAEWSRPGVH